MSGLTVLILKTAGNKSRLIRVITPLGTVALRFGAEDR